MKKIISIAVCIYLATFLNACTSSSSDGGNTDQPAADATLENPDGSAAQATADKPAGNPDEAQAGFLDDQLPEDTLGAAAKDANKPASDSAPLSLDDPSTAPPAENAIAAADTSTEKKEEPAKIEEPAKPKAALQKIKDAPYREGEQLVNAVYIARPNDDYKKISTMIYGSEDKVDWLKKANPGMKKVKPGQKVYYNSPKRPEDQSKIMNYYEEAGIPAETYVAKDGDDLKKVAKELVGYPEGWKEVWATNPVESKGKLPAGTELKFWKGAASVAATTPPTGTTEVAGAGTVSPPQPVIPQANITPPPPPVPEPQAAAAPQANMPPPPAPPEANMPPPPPPPEQMAKQDLPPPPPPPPEMAPPPPPPPMQAAKENAPNKKLKAPPTVPAEDGGLDQETMMYLGGAGVVALALAMLMIMRKKKAQKAASAAFEAQVS